jgi:hypothetical protein
MIPDFGEGVADRPQMWRPDLAIDANLIASRSFQDGDFETGEHLASSSAGWLSLDFASHKNLPCVCSGGQRITKLANRLTGKSFSPFPKGAPCYDILRCPTTSSDAARARERIVSEQSIMTKAESRRLSCFNLPEEALFLSKHGGIRPVVAHHQVDPASAVVRKFASLPRGRPSRELLASNRNSSLRLWALLKAADAARNRQMGPAGRPVRHGARSVRSRLWSA